MRRLFLLVSLLGGCDLGKLGGLGGGDDDDNDEFESHSEDVSASDGIGELRFEVESGVEAVLFTAESEGNYLTVEVLENPDGDWVFDNSDWYGDDNNLTGASYPYGSNTSFNWPIRGEDGDLEEGTWTVYFGVYSFGGAARDGDLDVDWHAKRDQDGFDEGTVRVRIVYADGLDEDEDLVEAVEGAVERWEEIYTDDGIDLEVEYASSSIDEDLSSPSFRSDQYTDVAEDTDGRQVTVLLGDSIDGSSSDYYGVAGSIPGTLDANGNAVVVISWIANSGGDGNFSTGDVRLFGETMAHEVGHYLGLFHPVEYTYDMWDALDDTDECTSENRCINDLGENLMFPYPICGFTSCDPQGVLTDDQDGVINRYTGTL